MTGRETPPMFLLGRELESAAPGSKMGARAQKNVDRHILLLALMYYISISETVYPSQQAGGARGESDGCQGISHAASVSPKYLLPSLKLRLRLHFGLAGQQTEGHPEHDKLGADHPTSRANRVRLGLGLGVARPFAVQPW